MPQPVLTIKVGSRWKVMAHLAAIAVELQRVPPNDVEALRRITRRLAINPSPPSHFAVVPVATPEIRGTWIIPKDANEQRRIVFCHGGSFVFGDVHLYGGFLSRLAAAATAPLFFVDYRLAPEFQYPAAHDDCARALRYVSRSGPYRDSSAAQIHLAGDSSGASLALSTACGAPEDGISVASVLAFSPFVDLSVSGESVVVNATRDPILTAAGAHGCAPGYAPGLQATDPRISPLYADLSSLKNLCIHGSMMDLLRDDATRLAERAHAAGVKTELHLWPEVPHCWYLFHDELPEARLGIEMAGHFMHIP
jgi:monoterpene epsilon-lactone hydrolase